MCESCVKLYGGDKVPVTAEMERVAQLVTRLHAMENCGAGGPLHIVTDDYNVEDEHLDYCETALVEAERWKWGADAQEIAWQIIDGLRPMSLAQRAATLWERGR